jgi:hypothetical protein
MAAAGTGIHDVEGYRVNGLVWMIYVGICVSLAGIACDLEWRRCEGRKGEKETWSKRPEKQFKESHTPCNAVQHCPTKQLTNATADTVSPTLTPIKNHLLDRRYVVIKFFSVTL